MKISFYAYPGIEQLPIERAWQDIEDIATTCGVTVAQMQGKSRERSIVNARFIAYAILRSRYYLPLKEVGKMLGGRDHTTIIAGHRTLINLCQSGDPIRDKVQILAPAMLTNWDALIRHKAA